MQLLWQTWTLAKKDLLIVGRRSWFTTLLRAFIFPVIVTFVVGYTRIIEANAEHWGVQEPSTVISLHDAFELSSRSNFVILDHHLPGEDVRAAIHKLKVTAQNANKNVLFVSSREELLDRCPASSKGITNCFAGVEFRSSPDQGPNHKWDYTLYFDWAIGRKFEVDSNTNDAQVYFLPLQHAIDSIITSSHGGPGIPNDIKQYGFTLNSDGPARRLDRSNFIILVNIYVAWVFFIGLCGIIYHVAGFVTHQREKGLFRLIDAMMPNRARWQCLVARILSTHLAFDLIYLPGWIAMGAITGGFTFPHTGAGWYILVYILAGLALNSYSILVSSFFKREQLGAIFAIVVAFVCGLAAQFADGAFLIYSETTPAWPLAILFPPCTFIYFIKLSAIDFESFSIDGGLPIPGWLAGYPGHGAGYLGLFVMQTVIYPIIGAVIEKFLHGCSSHSRHMRTRDEMGGHSVRLTGFSKHYTAAKKKREKIKAVDDLSLTLHAGSITVLLGTNGSGKSSTLNAIAGLETITDGQIEIDGTSRIGICPQNNVHWGSMTVAEHVRFFEQLKNPSFATTKSTQEVDMIISGCDLDLKKHARARTLAGGQMRKLQLAMMLVGGSQVCCIDEASSGLDPLSRRKIWDILLRERDQRTMLLTTHFLDETEILSDHVAILSKGKLKAEGSVTSLKNRFGGGYHVVLSRRTPSDRIPLLPQGVSCDHNHDATLLIAPDSAMLTPLLTVLERAGIFDYRIRGPTIDHVLLALAEEMKLEEDASVSENRVIPDGTEPRISDVPRGVVKGSNSSSLKLNTGQGCHPVKQTGVLFHKRLTVLKHNFMPYLAALFVPLVVAGMVTRFLVHKEYAGGLPCSNPAHELWTQFAEIYQVPNLGGVFGPQSTVSKADLKRLIPKRPPNGEAFYYSNDETARPWKAASFVDSLYEFDAAIQHIVKDEFLYGHQRWGGVYMGDENVFAYQGQDVDMPPGPCPNPLLAQGSLHILLSNVSFEFSGLTFREGFLPSDTVQGVVAILTVLGFTLYPGLLALYPTAERLRGVRAMQYSNGVLSSSLWTAYSLFDFMFILSISVFATVIWSACYHGWYALDYVFVVFLLYGVAATAYSYVISLFVKSQVAAMACTTFAQAIVAGLYFVGNYFSIHNAPATEQAAWLSFIYFTIGLICPAVSLFRALLITLNVYGLACKGPVKAPYPGEIGLFGGPILYLTVQILLLVAFLIFWESGRTLESFGLRNRGHDSIVEEIDEDTLDDDNHLTLTDDGLHVFNLTKSFGTNRAVENVSLGVLASEKLALLGPNGAGKSTAISLIRGELEPDPTDPPAAVYISGKSLMDAPIAAKNHLGVCPQFDAMDSMTVSEHLHFYARARGVPDKNANVQELLQTLGLTEHANKLPKKLPSGMRRRLSLAIALIANPSVLLLDEPSSGMDAAAKRALWSALNNISVGRCLLMTTHSMEEAAALCDRAGIMATNMLALGSISDLCALHGDLIHIHIVQVNAPHSTADEMEKIWQWVKSTFVFAEAEERTYGGQLRFAVPVRASSRDPKKLADGSDMARLFRILEYKKREIGIRDYSITPTTLEQVFLNVVSKHDVAEENTTFDEKREWALRRLLRRNDEKM